MEIVTTVNIVARDVAIDLNFFKNLNVGLTLFLVERDSLL
jgi:hypothetical protein